MPVGDESPGRCLWLNEVGRAPGLGGKAFWTRSQDLSQGEGSFVRTQCPILVTARWVIASKSIADASSL